MANIQLSTEGTGPRVATIEVSTEHRQIVILGDVSSTAAGTTGVTVGSAALLAGSSANTIGNVTVSNSVALSSGSVLGNSTAVIGIAALSTSTGGSIIDPRQVTVIGGTSGTGIGVIISTAAGSAAIDPRISTPSSQWTVTPSSQIGGSTYLDSVNEALRVNVVAGGAGGGVAQLQVRSTANAWTDVGYTTANFHVPVALTTDAYSTSLIDPRQATIVGATSGAGLGTILSTGAGGASIDPRARTWTLSTGESVGAALIEGSSANDIGVLLVSTGFGTAAIDPRQATLQAGSTGTVIGQVALSTGTGPLRVYGDVSTGSTAGVNPVGIGARVLGSTTLPVAGADGARIYPMLDRHGRQVVIGGGVPDITYSTGTTITTTSETGLIGAGAAGIYRDITHLTLTNRSTANVVRVVLAGSSGSGSSGFNITLAERGGYISNYDPPLKQTTAAASWTLTVVTGASTVDAIITVVERSTS